MLPESPPPEIIYLLNLCVRTIEPRNVLLHPIPCANVRHRVCREFGGSTIECFNLLLIPSWFKNDRCSSQRPCSRKEESQCQARPPTRGVATASVRCSRFAWDSESYRPQNYENHLFSKALQ